VSMSSRRAKPTAVCEILENQGFRFGSIDDADGEAEALYIKPRAGGASIYVTAPINCDFINESVVHEIMKTAKIPEEDYNHILK